MHSPHTALHKPHAITCTERRRADSTTVYSRHARSTTQGACARAREYVPDVLHTTPLTHQVALLFLTRGPVKTAAVWHAWFTTAALLELHPPTAPSFISPHPTPPAAPLPPAFLNTLAQHKKRSPLDPFNSSTWAPWTLLANTAGTNCSDLTALHDPVDVLELQTLFSVYVHPAVGYSYCKGDLFASRALAEHERVEVHWAQHTMVDAERALLGVALMDVHNQRFVMLSDSCIPVYPPHV